MLLTFSEERCRLLQEELAGIKEAYVNEPERTVKTLAAIKAALEAVTAKVKAEGFKDGAAEAVFNKTVYPELYAAYIYAAECFNTEEAKPRQSFKAIKNYYRTKITALSLYTRQHNFLHEYWRKGLDELDGLLFVSGQTVQHLFLPESPEFHAAGVPAATYLFARFIAYERLTKELLDKLVPGMVEKPKPGLKWTGNKVGIAELAYGLYYAGQFNNGNADVTDIYAWLESSLELDMASVHRKFTDIRRRNTASPTKLLDRMREAIHQRIDEDLSYKPNRGAKLKKPLRDDPDNDA
jgi:hypothetical protein